MTSSNPTTLSSWDRNNSLLMKMIRPRFLRSFLVITAAFHLHDYNGSCHHCHGLFITWTSLNNNRSSFMQQKDAISYIIHLNTAITQPISSFMAIKPLTWAATLVLTFWSFSTFSWLIRDTKTFKKDKLLFFYSILNLEPPTNLTLNTDTFNFKLL